MANEFKNVAAHSAEHFGDTRDHWWNLDTLRTIARLWRLESIQDVLDVGSGVGHWSRTLLHVLPASARLSGVDREAVWVESATAKAKAAGFGDRCHYQKASAESLPFPSASFDLVTCQTLLIHLRDPAEGLHEMLRVLRPGGLLLVAEPTNIAFNIIDSIALGDSPELAGRLVQFQLTCERGKSNVGEGNNLLGESLPRLLGRAGLRDIEVRLNDRVFWMAPPYDSPSQRVQIEEMVDMANRNIAVWDEATTRRYFLAGGGVEKDFASQWAAAVDQRKRCAEAVSKGEFATAGGGLFYLMWGRKP